MREKLEYKTPRASVRGVFLCENLADTATSVAVTGAGGILQEENFTGGASEEKNWYVDFDL
jgi:hypothetical protein